MNEDRQFGRRLGDQATARIKQVAILTQLRDNLQIIIQSGPKCKSLLFKAEQYQLALEQAEKLIDYVISSMNSDDAFSKFKKGD